MAGDSQAKTLIGMAHRDYEVVVDASGQPHAIPRSGPRVARPLQGRGGLEAAVTRAYFEETGNAPSANALTGAFRVLASQAEDGARVEVHLRVAPDGDGLVLDLGDPTGRVVIVRRGRWRVVSRPPEGIVFRRTQMTGAMRAPRRGGDLESLRPLINVTDESWDLVRAWLVCALLPRVPVPVLAATGPQGTGKTVLGRTLVGLIDPSPAPLRSTPKDASEWATTAAGSRVVALDNISRISEWLSDAMCRAVTGEGYAKRQLYTDNDLVVLSFRRALLLTSIDPGSMRGDLADRLLPVELRTLAPKRRRTEVALEKELNRRGPKILGGLLDLVAVVLDNPVKLASLPRMADAAEVMAAVDQAVPGSDALGAYRRSRKVVVGQVLEGDPLAHAVVRYAKAWPRGWDGTPTELYNDLRREALAHGESLTNWPANARAMSERLRRMAPALRSGDGLVVEHDRVKGRRVVLRWLRRRRR